MESMVLYGTLLKSVSAVGFSGKEAFHSQMFGATNFGLDLGDCNVIAMICVKKIYCKIDQDKFLSIVEDLHYHNLGYVGKTMPNYFSSKAAQNLNMKNPRHKR